MTDKSVLIPLKNTYQLKYQNHDLQETWRFVNENLTVQATIFQKKLACAGFKSVTEKSFAIICEGSELKIVPQAKYF